MRGLLRAAARLLRLAAHLVRGAWVLRWRFAHLPLPQQHQKVQVWSARTLALLGVELAVEGPFPSADQPVLVVANHVSWLDIATLHAVLPQARFVAKAEVRHWPLVGGLCRGVRTVFIERDRKRDAMRVVHDVAQALRDGDTVAFFPEGTTADGHALLPFHANLLQAASASGRPVLPVALRFSDPEHAVSPVVAYVGSTTLLQSLARVLRAPRLRATVLACTPLDSQGQERRALAQRCQAAIAARLQSIVPPPPGRWD
ncbi:MAG: lysophospholipid acyltransferase family protein [Pseudomonadota bacterium]